MLIVTGRLPSFPTAPAAPPGVPGFGHAPSPVMPRELGLGYALSGGSPAVTSMQKSLKGLSQATGRPQIDPGDPDGVVGQSTMFAIVAAWALLVEKLPAEASVPLQILLIGGATTEKGRDLVARFAPQLDAAARAATIKYLNPGGSPTTTPGQTGTGPTTTTSPTTTITPPIETPWFKQPTGMLAIGAGILGACGLIYALVK